MSKDTGPTDRYKQLETLSGAAASVASRRGESPRDEDIQNFAENTMNELLAWYGYGEKVNRNADHGSGTGQNPNREDSEPTLRSSSKARFLCSVTDPSDTQHPPDLVQPISESVMQKRSPSSSASSSHHRHKGDQYTRDVSSHSLDSTHSPMAARNCRPGSVNSLTSTDSTESTLLTSTKVPTREPADYSQNHQRHPAAMTKLKKVCDWCRQVPPSISLADAVDGLNQLSFCTELCLNHYKMNLFCSETQQYLQQIQSSEDGGGEVAVAASDNKILITPDLWLAEKKEGRRARFNESQMEIRAEDGGCRLLGVVDQEREEADVCRQSDCGSNVDTSNGMEFAEYLDRKKNKRKKEERALLMSSEISSETSFDVGTCAEERFSDGERRGKRFKTSGSTSKEAVSPVAYHPSVGANSLKKCLEMTPDAPKDSGSYTSPAGSSRVRGRSGLQVKSSDVFPLLHQATSSDLSGGDPTQFRRSSDASSTVERSKSEVPKVNCYGSRQGKPSSLQFPSSPLFGSSNPGLPSLMHLLGPTLNPQFLGAGAAVPPFPFLGIPSLFSMPGAGGTGGAGAGAGGGGVQAPPGIPIPPPVTNPWSSLLPPNTLMIPYPVLLPLPIPIPIPFPIPAKCGQQKGEKTAPADACSNRRQNDCSGKTDPGQEEEEEEGEDFKGKQPGDSRLLQQPSHSLKNQDSSFPNHSTIVCTCCRSESVPSRLLNDPPPPPPHSRSSFCSPCRNEGDPATHHPHPHHHHRANSFTDNPNVFFSPPQTGQAAQNLAIDFSMARDSKSSTNNMRSPASNSFTAAAAITPSSIAIKTEPLDLAISAENNNLSSSSPSSSSSLMMKSTCDMQSGLPPSLPYLARRSLILDAPSISKEKPPVHADKHFADTSSKKFMYCKRRYPSLHIKTK